MSKTKKTVGMLLALILVLAMSVSVLADNDGSITITNATEGETYSVYKMLDLTYSTGGTSYSYTIDPNSDWYAFFTTGAGASYVSVDATSYEVTWNQVLTGTDSIAQALAKAALAYAEENNISPTDTAVADDSGTVTFSSLDYGYYLIDSSLGTLCSLDSTAPSVEVTDKNSEPTVDKEVKEDTTGYYGDSNTADVGEEVFFRIEIADAYSSSSLVLHDTLSEGLTLNEGSFTVKIGASLSSANTTVDSGYYTITTTGLTDGCTFEISFTDEFLSTVLETTQVIVVEYTATVNSSAVIGTTDGNTNTTYVSYGNDSTSEKASTTTYVFELYVYKYTETTDNGNTTEVALSGAKFVLYKTINNVKYYVVLDETSGMVSTWTTDETEATELETGSDGLVYFGGLDAGTYELVETEAPAGYNLAASAVTIVIADDGTISGAGTVEVNGEDTQAIKIYNGSTEEMPSTGGIGTTIFYIVGGVLVVGAAVLLITRKRMNRA